MKLSEETYYHKDSHIVENDNLIKEILELTEKELSQHQLYYTRIISKKVRRIASLLTWSFWLVICYLVLKWFIDIGFSGLTRLQ